MTEFDPIDQPEKLPIDRVIGLLIEAAHKSGPIPVTLRAALANLSDDELNALKPAWSALPSDRREEILECLIEESEEHFDLDYDQISYLALTDSAPGVRQRTIDLLWVDESLYLMRRLKQIVQADDDAKVRATAASALGRFVLLGEYGEIPEDESNQLIDLLNGIWIDEGEDWLVRRRALESLGNSSAAGINEIIAEAYDSNDLEVRSSAIFAMGRTCDREHWGETVRRELTSTDDDLRYEAVRAAGELELRQSVSTLHNMALNDTDDVRKAAIWALGEIGGPQAQKYLAAIAEIVEETGGDSELEELVTEAIEHSTLPSFLEPDDSEED